MPTNCMCGLSGLKKGPWSVLEEPSGPAEAQETIIMWTSRGDSVTWTIWRYIQGKSRRSKWFKWMNTGKCKMMVRTVATASRRTWAHIWRNENLPVDAACSFLVKHQKMGAETGTQGTYWRLLRHWIRDQENHLWEVSSCAFLTCFQYKTLECWEKVELEIQRRE